MAKKSIKIKDLSSGLPASGVAPAGLALPDYDYAPLKKSLEDDGYDPENHTYIDIKEDGSVLNGNRRTHLLQQKLSLDQDSEIECEVKTHEEWIQDLKDVIDLKPEDVAKRDAEGGVLEPPSSEGWGSRTIQAHHPNLISGGGYNNLVARHKKKDNISGYKYDFTNSQGEDVDAGES
jgi:hypothetical protein